MLVMRGALIGCMALAVAVAVTGCGGKRPGAAPPKTPSALTAAEFESRAAEIQRAAAESSRPPAERAAALETEARAKLEENPKSAEAQVLLGQAAYSRADYAGAAGHYRQAVSLDGRNAVAWNLLGNAYRDNGQPQEAESAYRQALKMDSGLSVAYFNLTALLRIHGRLADAMKVAADATAQLPRDPEVWILLGDLQVEAGQREKAADAYRKALELAPGFPPLEQRLQELQAEMGRGS